MCRSITFPFSDAPRMRVQIVETVRRGFHPTETVLLKLCNGVALRDIGIVLQTVAVQIVQRGRFIEVNGLVGLVVPMQRKSRVGNGSVVDVVVKRRAD